MYVYVHDTLCMAMLFVMTDASREVCEPFIHTHSEVEISEGLGEGRDIQGMKGWICHPLNS